jgi:uncharacterized protein YbjQ (UPF0145 family)
MKCTVVSSKDVLKCMNFSPAHWIPEHHTEECNSQVRAKVKQFSEERKAARDVAIKKLQEEAQKDIDGFIETERRNAQ